MIDISIVIVNYNTKDYLRECISSIFQNKPPRDFKVFVVDNNSADGSSTMVKEMFPQVSLIENRENVGFATANNQVIRNTRSKYVLLLNSDTLVLGGAIDAMYNFLEEKEETAVVGCKILTPSGSFEASTHGFPSLTKEFFHANPALKKLLPHTGLIGKLIGKFFLSPGKGSLGSYWNYNEVREVEEVTGACFMVRYKAIEDVGYLDESFFIYEEEMDWCYRMKKKGWKTYFIPYGKIIHHFGTSTKQKYRGQVANRILVERYKSILYFFRKHYSEWETTILRFIILQGFGLRLCWNAFFYLLFPMCKAKQRISIYFAIIRLAILK